jgi:hypothetical protein
VKRLFALAALCAAAVLAGCKEPQSEPSNGFVRAGQDIVIKSARVYPSTDNTAFSNEQYYVITFNFTNHLGIGLVPNLDHFVIQDTGNVRYLGITSGSSTLAGISNTNDYLKVGDNHDYTVGFRVPLNTFGTLFYDATF